MNIKNNIEYLFKLNVSNYQISKDTKISQMTLSKYATGKSELGNMTLDNAIKLNDYYNKIKGEIEMKTIFNTIVNNYKADGSDVNNVKYVTLYNNKEDIYEERNDYESFENQFDVKVNELKFPVITLDPEGSLDGYLFDAKARRIDVMDVADDYFTSNNDGLNVWEFEEYNVYEEEDLLRFENKDNEVIGYVQIDLDAPYLTVLDELNKGADPITDKWEDGIGNTVTLDGWNLE